MEQVALESTGVYWRPVFNLLEADHDLLLVNAAHMKAVPGHKTDVKDAEWLADLLRHGLLTASFIPPQPVRDVRELTRYRQTLVHERAQEVLRVQRCWRVPTASWLPWQLTCSARAAGRCWRRWSVASRTLRRSRT